MTDLKKYFARISWSDLSKVLIIAILLIGIGLRFFQVERKVYSADEVRSILRFSGYTNREIQDQAFIGEIIGKEDLQQFQFPNDRRTLSDAVRSLSGNPEHPPFYHLLARFWMQGIPIPHSARIFSIFLSIVAIPFLYQLCGELFGDRKTGWIAIALFAVSPFQILVAQNTTQYSLWTVTTLFSAIALLRAMRLNTKKSWVIYSASLALTFYSHLFSASVAIAQAIYVIIIEKFKVTKTLISYILAGIFSLILFIPWLYVILTNLDAIDRNTQYYRQFKTNIFQISQTFSRHFGHLFFDLFHRKGGWEFAVHISLALLVLYSFYSLIRFTSVRVWLFVLTLILIPFLFQIIPDLVSQSVRSLQARYYLPVFLGIQISLSYLIASSLDSRSRKNWRHHWGRQIFLILAILGIVSGVLLGWTDDAGLDDQRGTASGTNLAIAVVLDRAEKPLVISEATPSFLLALSYLVNDRVQFQLFQNGKVEQWQEKLNLPKVKGQYSDLFLLYPDQQFLDFLSDRYSIRTEPVTEGLLKISPN
jgi:uncharacterized membrane protein